MPDYNYNPNAVTAGIFIFQPGDYEFKIGKPKPFVTRDDQGNEKNYGVRISVQEEESGERSVVSLYLHNDGSQAATKRFQMACLGYGKGRAEEQRFNADHGGDDWRLDFDSGDVGEGWKQLDGCRAIANVDVVPNKNTGDEMQNWKSWRPIEASN